MNRYPNEAEMKELESQVERYLASPQGRSKLILTRRQFAHS